MVETTWTSYQPFVLFRRFFLNVAEAKGMTAEAISEEMLAYWKESNRERRE